MAKNNTSGYKGVYWRESRKKWEVLIYVDGRRLYLGRYSDLDDAHKAYVEAAVKYFGDFAFGG